MRRYNVVLVKNNYIMTNFISSHCTRSKLTWKYKRCTFFNAFGGLSVHKEHVYQA